MDSETHDIGNVNIIFWYVFTAHA